MIAWLKKRWVQLLGIFGALGALLALCLRALRPAVQVHAEDVLKEQQEGAQAKAAKARAQADGHAAQGTQIEVQLEELEQAHAAEEMMSDEELARRFNERHGLRKPGLGTDRPG